VLFSIHFIRPIDFRRADFTARDHVTAPLEHEGDRSSGDFRMI